MMKKYIIAGALLAAITGAKAQDVNKLIDANDVDRIIKTLASDDMQGRGIYTPGIDKAATFIENEFKSAGLQPMKGASGFRQTFHLKKAVPGKLQVSINGTEIAPDRMMAVAHTNQNWTSLSGVEIIKETADKDFRKDYRSFLASGKKRLVLLDPSFESMFSMMRTRGGGGSVVKADPNLSVVFVVGTIADVKDLKVNYEVQMVDQPQELFDVAAMIPGKSKPDEYVVFSGHYDHLGIRKGAADSIFNGADDDASGTTAMISLAKYFKKIGGAERTLIFVAFTAEESGGYGASYFTTILNPDKVVAMFNIEMIGKDSKFGENTAFITGYERSDFGPILQKNLAGTAFKFYPDPYPDQNLFYRSDNRTLAELGVPAHTISTDKIDIDPYYHKATDEYSTLNVKNIISTIRAIALASKTIVSGKDTPTRIPKLVN